MVIRWWKTRMDVSIVQRTTYGNLLLTNPFCSVAPRRRNWKIQQHPENSNSWTHSKKRVWAFHAIQTNFPYGVTYLGLGEGHDDIVRRSAILYSLQRISHCLDGRGQKSQCCGKMTNESVISFSISIHDQRPHYILLSFIIIHTHGRQP